MTQNGYFSYIFINVEVPVFVVSSLFHSQHYRYVSGLVAGVSTKANDLAMLDSAIDMHITTVADNISAEEETF